MIDNPKEQLKHWPLSAREETISTLEALWKVARAAESLNKHLGVTVARDRRTMDLCADLNESLTALNETDSTTEVRK